MNTMKKLFLALMLAPLMASAAPPPGYCDVQVCNKLERFTLDPWKMAKDKFGEVCQPALLAKADAVAGKKLDSSSRWYQGSFNPTKSSVTRVKSVGACTPEAPAPIMAAPHAIRTESQKAPEPASATPNPPAKLAPASASAASGKEKK